MHRHAPRGWTNFPALDFVAEKTATKQSPKSLPHIAALDVRMNQHIDLYIEGTESDTQPVEVESISPNVFRILYSPGFVEDIAAGDVIRVTDQEKGSFEVIKYGGNVSVKISDIESIIDKLKSLEEVLSKVGGRLDGNLEHVAVWTIPVKSGFQEIEAAITSACDFLKEPTWWYGNVYDAQDKPLNWWKNHENI